MATTVYDYQKLISNLNERENWSHKEIILMLKCMRPGLTESAYHWMIYVLMQRCLLVRLGYDTYALSRDSLKSVYFPAYSEEAMKLIRLISSEYPEVKFTVFETVLMNEFLNHLIAQNTIFIQVEKDCSAYIFRYLQENGYVNVMYKPRVREFNLYWKRGCIVVTDMVSEAPLRKDMPHAIMLEKMLVDMLADKLIASTFSSSEVPDIFEQVESHYLLDRTRLCRYASRRNKHNSIDRYLKGFEENVVT